MTKSFRRLLAAAMFILALSAPAAAHATLMMPGDSSYIGHARSASAPAATAHTQAPVVPAAHVQPSAAAHSTTVASPAFQWDDAAIGAGVALALAGLGVGVVLVGRRRMHRPLAGRA